MRNIIWFASYCEESHDRATELKSFKKLKEAEYFMQDKRGYIERQEWEGERFSQTVKSQILLGVRNGYIPCAEERYCIANRLTVPFPALDITPYSWA